MNTTITPATQKQVDFLKALAGQIAEISDEGREWSRNFWFMLRKVEENDKLTSAFASEVITTTLEAKKYFQAKAPKVEQATPQFDVSSGRYAVDNEDGDTAFYKVNVTDYGKIFVDVQASDKYQKLPWKTAQAVLRKIEKDGPQEASARYGQELGVCGVCGRVLTDEISRDLGIGPICRNKF